MTAKCLHEPHFNLVREGTVTGYEKAYLSNTIR